MFITFEGPEGSGKTTQSRLLYRYLERKGYKAVLAQEPGGTALGRELREMVKHARGLPLSPMAEALLLIAARAQLVQEVVRPCLEQGIIVICDRYTDSTLAYQCYGRGLDMEWVRAINAFATGELVPDLTVLLDLAVEKGLQRKCSDLAPEWDRFEEEDLSFHYRVREGYRQLAAAEPDRWQVVEASRPTSDIHQQICRHVERYLSPPASSGAAGNGGDER